MNTLETDVEVSADGSLKLLSPLPAWLKPGRRHLLLTLPELPIPEQGTAKPRRVAPAATPEMLKKRRAALVRLRALGGLRDVIPDPADWQREMREDVTLPGRD